MKVRELVTKWGFDIDTRPIVDMQEKIQGAKDAMKEIAIKVAEAGAVLFELAHSTAEAGEKFEKLSQKTGFSVQSIQELSGAARLSGVDVDGFGHSLLLLNRRIGDARAGGAEGAKAFYQLGGGVSELVKSGASSEQIFTAVADRLSNITDEGKRGKLAMDIFGRSGAEMLPFLRKGASGIQDLRNQVVDLGGVMSGEAVAQGVEFEFSLKKTLIVITGLKNLIGGYLIPIVQDVMDKFRDWILVNKNVIKRDMVDFFKGLATFIQITWKWASALVTSFMGLVRIFGGFNNIIKFTLYTMSAFAALQIVSFLGGIAMAIVGLVSSFAALDVAMLTSQAIALAIPALIGLAIVAVGLLLEDVYQFFTGGDSVTGLLVQWFKDTFPNLTKFMGGIFEVVKFYIMAVVTAFQGWWDIMVLIGNWFATVFGPIIDYIGDKIAGFVGAIGKVAGFVGGVAGKALSVGGDVLGSLGVAGQEGLAGAGLGGLSPSSNPVTNNTTGGVQQNVSAPVQVNIHGNADPKAVGSAVSDGIQKGLDGILRQTGRNFAGGVAG